MLWVLELLTNIWYYRDPDFGGSRLEAWGYPMRGFVIAKNLISRGYQQTEQAQHFISERTVDNCDTVTSVVQGLRLMRWGALSTSAGWLEPKIGSRAGSIPLPDDCMTAALRCSFRQKRLLLSLHRNGRPERLWLSPAFTIIISLYSTLRALATGSETHPKQIDFRRLFSYVDFSSFWEIGRLSNLLLRHMASLFLIEFNLDLHATTFEKISLFKGRRKRLLAIIIAVCVIDNVKHVLTEWLNHSFFTDGAIGFGYLDRASKLSLIQYLKSGRGFAHHVPLKSNIAEEDWLCSGLPGPERAGKEPGSATDNKSSEEGAAGGDRRRVWRECLQRECYYIVQVLTKVKSCQLAPASRLTWMRVIIELRRKWFVSFFNQSIFFCAFVLSDLAWQFRNKSEHLWNREQQENA